jgi:hypothetical protein
MKKYDEYEDGKWPWTKYKIIVPTEDDRQELMEAFEHLHYSDVDPNIIAVNQLIHEYRDSEVADYAWNNIIVNPELYEEIKDIKGNPSEINK